ncbi:MAG: hypothetical protein GY792_13505 [Gammaproteobacteria bacterium]|nr:hypothetical protein [Gammaproteobacteria bacterium]
MKRWIALLMLALPLASLAGEYEQSLLVETGKIREGDLQVRNVTDLGSSMTCLAFYIRTSGTSPIIYCYPAASGLGANLRQVDHLKSDDLVIRKLEDTKNKMSCLVAYISTPGTSPAVDCYPYKQRFKDHMAEAGHLREGDLDVRRIIDSGNKKTCLVAYVRTEGTAPSVICYDSEAGIKGGLYQSSLLKAGDLVVRKITDTVSKKSCLVTYVSTAGTSAHLYCYDEGKTAVQP